MPVPSSYNDISTNSTIRDYVGWSWYQYEFYVPKRWTEDQLNVFLRFSSVHFKSIVVCRTVYILYFYDYCLAIIHDGLIFFLIHYYSITIVSTITAK